MLTDIPNQKNWGKCSVKFKKNKKISTILRNLQKHIKFDKYTVMVSKKKIKISKNVLPDFPKN